MVAGIAGILFIVPMYFLYDYVGSQFPPTITHPEFYYGFAGVTLAWQVAFLVIGRDPVRYRMLMVPAILEKFSYVLGNVALLLKHGITASQALPSAADLVFGLLFLAAFVKTARSQ